MVEILRAKWKLEKKKKEERRIKELCHCGADSVPYSSRFAIRVSVALRGGASFS